MPRKKATPKKDSPIRQMKILLVHALNDKDGKHSEDLEKALRLAKSLKSIEDQLEALMLFASSCINSLDKLDSSATNIDKDSFKAFFPPESPALIGKITKALDAIPTLAKEFKIGLYPTEQQKLIDILCTYIHPQEKGNIFLKTDAQFFRTHYCAALAEESLRKCIESFIPPAIEGGRSLKIGYDGRWHPTTAEEIAESTVTSVTSGSPFVTLIRQLRKPEFPSCTLPEGVLFKEFRPYSSSAAATVDGLHFEAPTNYVLVIEFTQVPDDFLDKFKQDIIDITKNPSTTETAASAGAGAAGPARSKTTLQCTVLWPDYEKITLELIAKYNESVRQDLLAQKKEEEAFRKTAQLFSAGITRPAPGTITHAAPGAI
jgi:hypothetical protein